MSERGDLLELMDGAAERVRTVRAVVVQRHQPALMRRAYERFESERSPGGARMSLVRVGPAGPDPVPDEWQETRHRIWAEPPDRHRDELEGPHRWISVRDGDRWLDWSPSTGLREERGATRGGGGWDLLDPAWLLGGFRLERTGEGEVAGRRALLLRGRRRGSAFHGEIHPGIDEIALAVDVERGVLLRLAQLVDGEPCSLREVEEIAFDEEPPPGTFELVPPAGTELPKRPEPTFTTLDAAVGAASFQVWKLDPVPSGWTVQAVYMGAAEELGLAESVTLLYARRDGGEHLQLHESPVRSFEPPPQAERLTREGRAFVAFGPEEPEGRDPAQLVFELYGTHVLISSSQLARERLLELAGGLVEA